MKILTFDTSLDKLYVTLSEEENLLTSATIENKEDKYHSAFLIPTIADIIKAKTLTMRDINAIGVNVGPGSFTGIRACVTVARVMAQQLNIPAVGISSLQIISLLNKTSKPSMVLLDARKEKAYCAIYSPDGEIIEAPCAVKYTDVIENLNIEPEKYFRLTDSKMSSILQENGITSTIYNEAEANLGENLAKLTHTYLKENKEYNLFNLKPLYIQPPPITMPAAHKK